MTKQHFDFIVNRSNLAETMVETPETAMLDGGEVRLQINRFALTSNNITYGVAGDMIGYWQFFPCKQDWGRIPVWGIATVTESQCEGINVGDLYYGYYPMSDQLVVAPIKLTNRGFSDGSAHRQELPSVYNQYALMTEANGFLPQHHNHHIVYRPLFMTSFVIDDFFADNNFFDAKQIILSSASSKTAFGTAFQLKSRDKHIVGLTSAGNKAFVEALDLYDEVITYDQVESIDASQPSAYIDMSGNREILNAVHQHSQDNLKYSCGVGITHWDANSNVDPAKLPGAKPTMFFAPTQIQKRTKEWGAETLQINIASAWDKFVDAVDHWVKFEESSAPKALPDTYKILLDGPAPNKAYVVTID